MQKRFMITLLIFGFVFRKTDTQSGLKEKPDITFSFVTRCPCQQLNVAFLRWLYIVDGNRGIVTGKTGNGNQFVRGGEKEDAARPGTSIIENGIKRENGNPPLNSALA